MVDDRVHIGADLNRRRGKEPRCVDLGLALDLPADVTTGCGIRVPLAFTARLAERVTCPACRDYAHRKYLDHAAQIERLGPMMGMNITSTELAEAMRAPRQIAMTFLGPGDQESTMDQ